MGRRPIQGNEERWWRELQPAFAWRILTCSSSERYQGADSASPAFRVKKHS